MVVTVGGGKGRTRVIVQVEHTDGGVVVIGKYLGGVG